MSVYMKDIVVQSTGKEPSFINVTNQVKTIICESGIQNGVCHVITPHTTCSILFEEFTHDVDECGTEWLLKDFNDCLEKIIPPHCDKSVYHYPGEEHYKAVLSWKNRSDYLPNNDLTMLWNGDAHIKASMIGASETFVVQHNKLALGKTGYIYLVDFDRTRARTRKCQVVILGE